LKAFLSVFVLSFILVGTLFSLPTEQKEVSIEDWYADTSKLFQSASAFFSRTAQSNDVEIEVEQLSLDSKLQALLPSSNIDLSYQSDEHTSIITSAASDSQSLLLPDLFKLTNSGPSTQFNGQVHTDNDDNIVGAEVNVSIPTDIR
jgi:hypothetical protein